MQTLQQTIEREWLEGRYLVLELAALLDRLDEAAKRDGRNIPADLRLRRLADAIAVIASPSSQPDRAERILRIYSDEA